MSDTAEPDTPNTAKGDAEILADARAYLRQCEAADGENRVRALDDLGFLAGEQWSPQDRNQRLLTGRPCLTFNSLPTFLHQVTNDQRQNRIAVKVHPVSDDDKKRSDIVQGLIRHIEYESSATTASMTAVNSAAAIGFGYFRLVTEYCDEMSFDQDIRFKRIRNAFTVYFDPGAAELDGSDQRRCLISEKMPKELFKRQYPKASTTGEGLAYGIGDDARSWYFEDYVRVAEFYCVEEKSRWLVRTQRGPVWEDDLAEGDQVMVGRDGKPMRRKSLKREVWWYKITGAEVLERTEIPCRWIPVFPVYGDEIDLDGKVIRSGIVRNAKDPARMKNYWYTAATEEVALRSKTPWVGAEGQFEGHEDEWAQANTSSFPYLEYKPTSLEGVLAPPPSRQPMADVPIGTITMARFAADEIKATTGLFDSSIGNKGTATSGIQERAQQLQGDTANFHYQDNLQITYRHVGRVILDMLPRVYDGARVLKIMSEDEKVSAQPVNGMTPEAPDITNAKYDITLGTGPAYSTARQEAAESLIELGKAWPPLMQIAGDKVVATMDFHGSDEVAERIKRTIPPAIVGDEEGGPMVQTPKGPIPIEQAGQMLVQMDQQMQAMGAELADAKAGITKAQIEAQKSIQVAQINAAASAQKSEMAYLSAQDVAELRGVIDLLKVRMQPPPQLVADASVTGKANGKEPMQ